MSVWDVGKLAARHLRFQRALLALHRHTEGFGDALRSDSWAAWVEERQRLVSAVAAENGEGLAADTAAARAEVEPELASRLAALHELEVETAEAILRLDGRVRAAARARLAVVLRRLQVTRDAQAARRGYGGRAEAVGRLSRQG